MTLISNEASSVSQVGSVQLWRLTTLANPTTASPTIRSFKISANVRWFYLLTSIYTIIKKHSKFLVYNHKGKTNTPILCRLYYSSISPKEDTLFILCYTK